MNNRISAPTQEQLTAYLDELRGGIDRSHNIANGIYCIVLLGQITEQPGTYDAEGNELTPPVLSERYHADILADRELILPDGITRHTPTSPVHGFA